MVECCCDPGTDALVGLPGPDNFYITVASGIQERAKDSGGVEQTHVVTNNNITEIDLYRDVYAYDSNGAGGYGTEIYLRKRTLNNDLLWEWSKTDGNADYQYLEPGQTTVEYGGKIGIDSKLNVYICWSIRNRYNHPIHSFIFRDDAYVTKIDKNGNTVWESHIEGPGFPPTPFGRWGYIPKDLTLLPNGDVHVTGLSQFVGGGTSTDRFEWRLDSDGSTVWTDIRTTDLSSGTASSTLGDGDQNSYGTFVISDRYNNIHVAYSQGDDDLVLVGYDVSGNILYEYDSTDIPATPIKMIQHKNDSLWIMGGSGAGVGSTNAAIRKYSTTTNYWDTIDWANFNFGSSIDFNIDLAGNAFCSYDAPGFGQNGVAGITPEGVTTFDLSFASGILGQIMAWPGRNFVR